MIGTSGEGHGPGGAGGRNGLDAGTVSPVEGRRRTAANGDGTPALSVVLVTTGSADLLRLPLEWLAHQTVHDRMELLVVGPDAGLEADLRAELGRFASHLVVENPVSSMGAARAAGVRAASAPLVAFGETHAFPDPRWAEELLAVYRDGYAAVAPRMVNANPENPNSRAEYLLNFGSWSDVETGPRDLLPWHNTAYARDVLLPYGDRLADLLEVEHLLQDDLRREGHRLALSAASRVQHANFETLSEALAVQHSGARLFGAIRGRDWSPWRRGLYVLASPLFPLLRLRTVVRDARRAPPPGGLAPIAPRVGLLLLAAAVGEAAGYVGGAGRAHAQRCVLEMAPRIPAERAPPRPGVGGGES